MMPQSIDKGKIYLYFFLLFFLLSIHNINSLKFVKNFFKINKIILDSELDENLNEKIYNSMHQFYNYNIFSINADEIREKLNEFNSISEYRVKKEFPSVIKIELKPTEILAYYFENNQKIYLGENGKKINGNELFKDNLPLIVGQFDTQNFFKLKEKLMIHGFIIEDFKKFYSYKSKRWDLLYNSIIIKLPIDDLDNSLIKLKEIINNLDINNLKVIDLRNKNNIILS